MNYKKSSVHLSTHKENRQIIKEESYHISLTHTKTQKILRHPKNRNDKSIGKTKPSWHDNTSNIQVDDQDGKKKKAAKKNPKENKKKKEETGKQKQAQTKHQSRRKENNKETDNRTAKSSKKQFSIKLKNPQKTTPKATIRRQNISNKETVRLKINALPSYREYCLVEGQFLPISNSNECRFIDQLLADTATTSPDFEKSPFYKVKCDCAEFGNEQAIKEIQSKSSISDIKQLDQDEKFRADSLKIGLKVALKQMKNQSILVRAAQEEIGVQYSERKSLLSEERITSLIKIDEKFSEKGQGNLQDNQIFKTILNFSNLCPSDQQSLQNLDVLEKRKYREILQNLMLRMQSPRPQITPRSFSPNDSHISKESLIINSLKSHPYHTQNAQPDQDSESGREEQQFLQQSIYAREAKQLGQIPTLVRQNSNQINTSLVSLLNIFQNFFCYIQINYIQDLLQAINRMYGWSYMDKYRFISKNYRQKSSSSKQTIAGEIIKEITKRESNFSIIKESVYEQFSKEIMSHQKQNNDKQMFQYFHSHAVFDCINQLLKPYQPFYTTKGDSFPWSLSLIRCFTFYSIDEESISIVISQIRTKFIKDICKSLCGILISHYPPEETRMKKKESKVNPIDEHRREREQKMILEELEEQNINKGCLQNSFFSEYEIFVTSLFHELALQITSNIVSEATFDIQVVLKR